MNKPTVHDIAREAGVSLSTVDRVLNARSGVRKQNAERVKAAVEKLGYVRDTNAANLAKRRQYQFVFVLPEGPNEFVETLGDALREANAAEVSDRVLSKTFYVNASDPHAVVTVLQSINTDQIDGVALMVPETPQVRDAIAHLKEEGVFVVALGTDLPNSECDHYVGVNSFAAGKTAAMLLGRFVRSDEGSILVAANSMASRDSIERRLGLDDIVSDEFPGLKTLPTIELHDDPERIRDVVSFALTAHPDLVGLYVMGPLNEALLDALRGCDKARRPVVIAHELTPLSRLALLDRDIDAVITQNVGHLARSALRVLRAKCDDARIFEAQERIRIEIVIRENVS
jgi:LacI family transcriptional regulator